MSSARIAIFAPLPPSPTGVADYAAELLPHLCRHFRAVDVYVKDDTDAPPRDAGAYRVLSHQRFEAVDGASPYDAVLYHHGNNTQHAYIYEQSLRRRGIALLHDAVLHHFVATTTIPVGDFGLYAAELRYAEGRAGEKLALSRAYGLMADWHQYLTPLFDRVLEHSEGLLVHGRHVAREVRHRFPHLPVRRVAHHFSPPPPEIDALSRAEARRRLSLAEDAFIVGSFGFVTPSKRVEVALEGFAALARRDPRALYCVVGELSQFDLGAGRRLGIASQVRYAGRVPMDTFQTYLAAVDVVVNLRYPSAGESSGTLVRSLGAGKPVLVSKMPYCADYPLDVTLQMPVGPGEVEAIAAALTRLREEPAFAERLGAAARAHVRARCTLEGSAARQAEFIHECIARRARH